MEDGICLDGIEPFFLFPPIFAKEKILLAQRRKDVVEDTYDREFCAFLTKSREFSY